MHIGLLYVAVIFPKAWSITASTLDSEKEIQYEAADRCPICLDDIEKKIVDPKVENEIEAKKNINNYRKIGKKDPLMITPCFHIFCNECLGKNHAAGKKECPICRSEIFAGKSVEEDNYFVLYLAYFVLMILNWINLSMHSFFSIQVNYMIEVLDITKYIYSFVPNITRDLTKRNDIVICDAMIEDIVSFVRMTFLDVLNTIIAHNEYSRSFRLYLLTNHIFYATVKIAYIFFHVINNVFGSGLVVSMTHNYIAYLIYSVCIIYHMYLPYILISYSFPYFYHWIALWAIFYLLNCAYLPRLCDQSDHNIFCQLQKFRLTYSRT